MTNLSSPVLDEILAAERRGLDDAFAEITALARINSGTRNVAGTTAVQQLLRDRFEDAGLDTTLTECPPATNVEDDGQPGSFPLGPVLHAQLRPSATNRLTIVGHADTVFGPEHSFQDVLRDGDRLRGPGVADMKGGLVALCHALRAIGDHNLVPDLGIDVVVNADEEIGSPGSAPMLEAFAARTTSGHALVVEPRLPDGGFAGARAGSANIAVTFTGTSAHAGRALAEGRNAVVSAARLANFADSLTNQPALGVNVAAISGGNALNAVPDSCVLRINLRSTANERLHTALDEIDTWCRQESERSDVAITRLGDVHRPAKPWTAASRALADNVSAGAAHLDLPDHFTDTGGVCDGNNLSAQGIAVVDTLGIAGGGIHTDDEFADLASWPQIVALLVHSIVGVRELTPTS